MEDTYKICIACDASGYDRSTKNRCPVCNGQGIKILLIEKEIKKEKLEQKND